MDVDYDRQLIVWAHTYDAYKRLAGEDPNNLLRLVEPLQQAYDRDGRIPSWAGVDLLRGWAFYLVRAHRHSGEDAFSEDEPAILAIVDAVNRHPDVREDERAPER